MVWVTIFSMLKLSSLSGVFYNVKCCLSFHSEDGSWLVLATVLFFYGPVLGHFHPKPHRNGAGIIPMPPICTPRNISGAITQRGTAFG